MVNLNWENLEVEGFRPGSPIEEIKCISQGKSSEIYLLVTSGLENPELWKSQGVRSVVSET